MMGGRRQIVLAFPCSRWRRRPHVRPRRRASRWSCRAGHGDQPIDGRLLLLLSTDPSAEPRMQIGDSPTHAAGVRHGRGRAAPGQPVAFDTRRTRLSRSASLSDVPAGDYYVQAVLHRYETFHRADGHTVKLPMDRGEGQHWNLAPGNLYSTPRKVALGLAGSGDDRRWTRRSRRSLSRRTRSTSAT